MTDLAAACDGLAAALPRAAALIACQDADGTTGRGKPGSAPPWNSAVANALLDALEGVGRLEVAMRGTGAATERRPMAQTGAALESIARLAPSVTEDEERDAVRMVRGWETAILQLAGIDEIERSQKVTADCPYCGFAMLRVYPRSGRIACLRIGACTDSNGDHPTGLMGRSSVDGSARVFWADGLVT